MAIQKLNSRHKEMAQLLMRGKTQRKVAQGIGLSESHLSRICHSPVFREYMSELQNNADDQLLERMKQERWKAVNKTLDAFHDPKSTRSQKLKVASKILGYSR